MMIRKKHLDAAITIFFKYLTKNLFGIELCKIDCAAVVKFEIPFFWV
jgi:hypothetical protein